MTIFWVRCYVLPNIKRVVYEWGRGREGALCKNYRVVITRTSTLDENQVSCVVFTDTRTVYVSRLRRNYKGSQDGIWKSSRTWPLFCEEPDPGSTLPSTSSECRWRVWTSCSLGDSEPPNNVISDWLCAPPSLCNGHSFSSVSKLFTII